MSQLLKLATAICLAMGVAHAGVITVSATIPPAAATANGLFSSKSGVCTVDFNAGTAANGCGATYSSAPDGTGALSAGSIVQGSSSGVYAAPPGDTSFYLTVSPAASTSTYIDLAAAANYFGFFTGSLDDYNSAAFFFNGVLVDSFTGTDVNLIAFHEAPTGNQSQAAYVDFSTTGHELFNQVELISTSNAFETDNDAFGVVPEPAPLALLGLGALVLFAVRRQKRPHRDKARPSHACSRTESLRVMTRSRGYQSPSSRNFSLPTSGVDRLP